MIILAWLRFEEGVLDLTSAQIEASVVQLQYYDNLSVFLILSMLIDRDIVSVMVEHRTLNRELRARIARCGKSFVMYEMIYITLMKTNGYETVVL